MYVQSVTLRDLLGTATKKTYRFKSKALLIHFEDKKIQIFYAIIYNSIFVLHRFLYNGRF